MCEVNWNLFLFWPTAAFLPESLTVTASIGEYVNISYVRKEVLQMDPLIFKNGMNAWLNKIKFIQGRGIILEFYESLSVEMGVPQFCLMVNLND